MNTSYANKALVAPVYGRAGGRWCCRVRSRVGRGGRASGAFSCTHVSLVPRPEWNPGWGNNWDWNNCHDWEDNTGPAGWGPPPPWAPPPPPPPPWAPWAHVMWNPGANHWGYWNNGKWKPV